MDVALITVITVKCVIVIAVKCIVGGGRGRVRGTVDEDVMKSTIKLCLLPAHTTGHDLI